MNVLFTVLILWLYITDDEDDRRTCLMAIMKAVLEKAGHELQLGTALPTLFPETGQISVSFFQQIQLEENQQLWATWIDDQVL